MRQEFNSEVAKRSLTLILKSTNFERFEIKRINLLRDIFHSTSKRDRNILKLIKEQILHNTNFDILFKPFIEKDGLFYVKVSNFKLLCIHKDHEDTETYPNLIPYLAKTVSLAVELCKGYSTIFEARYRQFLPMELCIRIIECPSINSLLRGEILFFYKECYLEAKCISVLEQVVPELLWFKNATDKSKLKQVWEDKRSEILVHMNLQNTSDISLIPFLYEYIRDPSNYNNIEESSPLISQILDIFMFLIKRAFLDPG